MPQDIEDAFRGVGLSLFPERLAELDTDCSCPDWSNPCKHIAAVYYLLGEEFDRDPFLLFTLRGLSRDELMALLAEAAPVAPTTPATAAEPETPASLESAVLAVEVPSEPVPAEATTFWGSGALPENLIGPVSVPPVTAPVLRRLGAFPFWRGPVPLSEALTPHFGTAAQRGLDVLAGTDAR